MNRRSKEDFKFSFGPLKFECNNVGNRTIIIVLLVLVFCLLLIRFAPTAFIVGLVRNTVDIISALRNPVSR